VTLPGFEEVFSTSKNVTIMRVHVHVYMHVYIYMYVYMYAYTFIYTRVWVYICTRVGAFCLFVLSNRMRVRGGIGSGVFSSLFMVSAC